MRFVAGRLLRGALLLAGVSILSFLFFEMAPGDYFDEMRMNPQISRETVAALKAQYGMDRPLHEKYLRWLGSTLRGDMGFSFAYNGPVAPLIRGRALNTLLLTATATLLAWAIAVPWGVWSAAAAGGWADRLGNAVTSVVLAVPDVLVGLGLMLLAVRTGLFPAAGMTSVAAAEAGGWTGALDVAHHLVLPVAALVLGSVPVLFRHVRASMTEVLASPFIVATRAHGIPRTRLLFRHALPAAANPLASLFGLSVASLLSGSLLVEVIMSWPGLGPLLLEAILARDIHLVLGPVMASTLLLLVGNLAADLLLYAADPRIRRRPA
jgi:peptide/nickel transport system permease protein